MRLRSLLFVPGDRPERFAKAALSADGLILDLEDSVVDHRKPIAREAIAAALRAPPAGPRIFVRVNALGGQHIAHDLECLRGLNPDGVLLPKAEGAPSIAALQHLLAKAGLSEVKILPIVTETPFALFQLGSYVEAAAALAGLTWGAEDLPAAIGATTSREDDGRYTPPYELARSLTLFAAHAAGVAAIETVFPDFRNEEGLHQYAARASQDGFTGMMAIHPAQVPIINAAFTPSEAAVARARNIVAAFEASPGRGALQLDGVMIDAPHLKQALRILGRI